MQPFYPDVVIFSNNYSLKVKLSTSLKNNRVYSLRNINELQDITHNNNCFIFIWELSKATLNHMQFLFAKLYEQENNIEVLCICNNDNCGDFIKKIISYVNQKPIRLHFSSYHTLTHSIKIASCHILESKLAKIAESHECLNYITLKHKNKNLILVENFIKYVEKAGKSVVKVKLSSNNTIESTSNLKDIISQSTPCLFQSHKSFLVNVRYIKTVSPNEWNNYDIMLDDELIVPLSKGFFPYFTVAKNFIKSSNIYSFK